MSRHKHKHEGEPPKEPWFRLIALGREYIATPRNTAAFLHADPRYDHIYMQLDDDPENAPKGIYVFREACGDEDSFFNPTVQYMRDNNFPVIEKDAVDPNDLEVYNNWKASLVETVAIPTIDEEYITQRQQHHIDFLHYLIEHNMIDFGQEGEIPL